MIMMSEIIIRWMSDGGLGIAKILIDAGIIGEDIEEEIIELEHCRVNLSSSVQAFSTYKI